MVAAAMVESEAAGGSEAEATAVAPRAEADAAGAWPEAEQWAAASPVARAATVA